LTIDKAPYKTTESEWRNNILDLLHSMEKQDMLEYKGGRYLWVQ
jgi:hypothetical protein